MDTGSHAILNALTGGLAGALLTLLTQSLWKWWRRPILEILFDKKEPGCLLATNKVGGSEVVECYVRLKVRNRGCSTARDVSLCAIKLEIEQHGRGVKIFEDEVLDLLLAPFRKPEPFRLAPGAHRYMDLFHTEQTDGGTKPEYIFAGIPAKLTLDGIRAGTYRAEIYATAENAASVRRVVSWSWDGGFPGLDVLGMSRRPLRPLS